MLRFWEKTEKSTFQRVQNSELYELILLSQTTCRKLLLLSLQLLCSVLTLQQLVINYSIAFVVNSYLILVEK